MSDEAASKLTIEYDHRRYGLVYANLPLSEHRACRVETGLSVQKWMSDIDAGTIAVLWWLARRANGEPTLAYLTAEQQWDASKLGTVDFGGAEKAADETDPES